MNIILNTSGNNYLLSGNLDLIKKYSRRVSNFESIGASFEQENCIVIPFSTENDINDFPDKEKQYESILELFRRFEIDYSKTEETNKLVNDIDIENEKFQQFSLKAKNIRNNVHENNDFANFISIIEKKLTRSLYKLQLLSSYHLAFAQFACNFSVPGAGKTSTVYGAYGYLKSLSDIDKKRVDRLLIICPLAAFAPWKNEFKECFGVEATIKELVGVSAEDRRNHFYSDSYTEITLISYQSASNESDIENIKAYLKRYKVMVVLDEAHKIKNVNGGKQAEAILSISKYATSRVVLTGTPAPNGYQDLYNLYKFIYPNHDIIGYPLHYLQEISDSYTPRTKQDIKHLIDNISPFFIRVKKSDLNLPNPVYNKPIIVQMNDKQRKIYNYIEKKYIDYFEEDNNSGLLNSLKKAKLIRLMQCLTNPNLLNKTLDNYLLSNGLNNTLSIDDRDIMETIQSFYKLEVIPPKFVRVKELVEEIIKNTGPQGKVIIWTIFVQNIIDLKKYLQSQNIECELLYGETPNENDETPSDILTREKIIDKFHKIDCNYKVLIANPFAVGESISLHKACHNAIYLEKNFNAAMYMQSKDRVHRYGLDNNDIINYYYLLSEDSIDLTIHNRILEKEKRMLDIIESEEIPLLNMNDLEEDINNDDIQAIIKDYYDRKNSQ